jgi:alpha-tubulin suppressor-like RCC1 family protein
MSGIDSITTGHYHSMALDEDSGTVWAWGWNSRGQIGPAGGTAGKVGTPVKVALPVGNVTMIAAGRAHSLAIVAGKVYAWGDNGSGQLGTVADTARHSNPLPVIGLPAGVTWVAGGRDSSFAIAGGDLYAWGNNQYGQLGTGSTISTPTPTKVLGSVKQVESGADHTVALLTNGAVDAWGRNEHGQLGVVGGSNHPSPTPVMGLPAGITQVRVGRDHSMAIDGSGNLYAWGRNDGGQLGVSPSGLPETSTPTKVGGAGAVKDVGGGQVYTVVLQR